MDIQFSSEPLDTIAADLSFVIVFEAKENQSVLLRKEDGGAALDRILGGALSHLLQAQDFRGKEGETLLLYTHQKIKPKYVLVVGAGLRRAEAASAAQAGAAQNFSTETLRKLGGKITQEANRIKASSISGLVEAARWQNISAELRLQAFVEGALLANYQFDLFKEKGKQKKNSLKTIWFLCKGNTSRLQKAVEQSRMIAEGVTLARDLTNLPPNYLTPTELGRRAQALAQKYKNISVRVLGPKEIRSQKMGALLAVAQGSNTPPAFIHLHYRPSGKAKTKVAIVGKGITFDSGGLNIKTKEMELMKFDMGGAAAVLGIFRALAELKPKVAVEGFIPAAENMPAGNAYRPSDIITTRSGKTVEITNTDAEGRLALADALDFACEAKPDFIIDMATLTGGAAYALGELVTPILGNDKKLVGRLIAAGQKAGERAWELPIVQDYKKGYLKGPADLKNSGSGTKASTISGALFLEEFVKKNKWAHMDIASTAWADEPTSYHPMIGATGTPVRTLVYFLMGL